MTDDFTQHYGFQKLKAGEPFSKNSYKFTQADRDLMDRLVYLGAEGHHHVGGTSVADAPTVAPTLQIDTTDGSMPASTRYFYKYTLVDPQGFESAASPESFTDTPLAVQPPGAGTNIAFVETGGTLPPGNFYYVLSAYTQFDNLETTADNAVFIQVPYNTNTNVITFTLPVLPGGADGFNVYRRTPSGTAYFHIGSIDMTGTTPPTTFSDNGTAVENCDRMAPQVNTAKSRNSIIVSIPGPAPSVPVGYSWRIYRSLTQGVYDNSLLTTISDGSVTYLDTGTMTTAGQPPTVGLSPGAPARIDLTDGREVQGRLPLSRIAAFPFSETFSYPGPVVAMEGTTVWVCPFPQATIVGVQAALGKGSIADTQPVIIDVNVYKPSDPTPAWSSIYADSASQPQVAVGEQVGTQVTASAVSELVQGDLVTVDIDQDGGGTVDRDLTVMLSLLVYGWTSDVSHPWAP